MLNVFVAIIIAITWIALEKLITTYLSGRVDKYEKKEEINTYPFVIKQTVLIRIFNFITLAVVILAAIVVNVLLYQDILNHYGFVILFNFVLLLFFINHLYSALEYFFHRFYVYDDYILETYFGRNKIIKYTDAAFTTISNDFIIIDINNKKNFVIRDTYCGIESFKQTLFKKNVEAIDYTKVKEFLSNSKNDANFLRFISSNFVTGMLLLSCIILSIQLINKEKPTKIRNEIVGITSLISINKSSNKIDISLEDDTFIYEISDVSYRVADPKIFDDLISGISVNIGFYKEQNNIRYVNYISFQRPDDELRIHAYVSRYSWYNYVDKYYNSFKNCGYMFLLLSIGISLNEIYLIYDYYSKKKIVK